jgi:RimK family alpha-L-glutamate ligase
MKISLIVKNGGWHTEELRNAAVRKKIDFETLKITSLNEYEKKLAKTGDVIIWFSSGLKSLDKKATLFHLMRDSVVINADCLKWPFLTRKLFQQKYLEKFSSLSGILTFSFQDKKDLLESIPEKLNFPIIQKPNYGSQGDNISLLKSKKDILKLKNNIPDYIYQNFIPNDGDYRILIVGGKALGVIKRTAKAGGFLNNVSKGGQAVVVSDPILLKTLKRIALAAASLFDLSICGVDIIYDKENNKYRLMEINTNPEWRGFQTATKINVAEKIIDYCVAIHARRKKNTPALVKEYFDSNYDYLDGQKFHYASRMWLWTKEDFYRKKIDLLETSYLENSFDGQVAVFKKILKEKTIYDNLIAGNLRKKYLKRYPQLSAYSRILFLCLFARTIYKKDLRAVVKKVVDDEKLKSLRNDLKKDRMAIAALSTYAVNFLYLTADYFKKPDSITPRVLLDIFKEKNTELSEHPELRAYMLTHAIIGETRFYSQKIVFHIEEYSSMVKELDKFIKDNYFKLALDIKFEFLVCCDLCNYNSEIRNMILEEAGRSLADNGNFLVSRLNDTRGFLTRNILDSEHRNVLYVMTNMKERI